VSVKVERTRLGIFERSEEIPLQLMVIVVIILSRIG